MRLPANSTPEPLIAWPGRRNLGISLLLGFLFFATFYGLYGAASFVTELHPWRLQLFFEFELAIPFWPSWAVVYLSLNLILALAPFILRGWQTLLPLVLTLMAESAVAAVIFILLPLEGGFPQAEAGGLAGLFLHLADRLNLDHNYLPSLHVAFALTAALAYSQRARPLTAGLLVLWALAIAASTILIHEHHLLDIIAGLILAVAAMHLVYRRTARPTFLERFKIELICLYEFFCFSRRHPRYFLIFMGIYRYALFRWNDSRLIRAAYCLAQHVDDVLDGDRMIDTDARSYVCGLIRQIELDDYSQEPMGLLAGAIIRDSANYEQKPGEFKENLLKLFRVMLFDLQRREGKLLLSDQELAEHHRQTFYYSANLTLILARSSLRADDVPELIGALSWCSPLRDLRDDLAKGIINIPRAVLEQAREQGAVGCDYASLIATPAVQSWVQAEFARGKYFIEAAFIKLDRLQDSAGLMVLRPLAGALKRYADKYARKHRDLLKAPLAPEM